MLRTNQPNPAASEFFMENLISIFFSGPTIRVASAVKSNDSYRRELFREASAVKSNDPYRRDGRVVFGKGKKMEMNKTDSTVSIIQKQSQEN